MVDLMLYFVELQFADNTLATYGFKLFSSVKCFHMIDLIYLTEVLLLHILMLYTQLQGIPTIHAFVLPCWINMHGQPSVS